ncbi:cytochrome b/b6 domain-containing protein [Pseudohaliea sp.]|uniref:cytochrome b/b6 domain-containing protein n=1 Tax=Pseudohaliea sp. TaxID=2740289 RepID=UPI0032ECD59D
MSDTATDTARHEGTAPPAGRPGSEIKVWDLLVRLGHWTLVIAFTIAWLTGEEESALHIWSGYAIAAVVALRLCWGLVGTRHARFSDFVRGPRAVIDYLRGLAAGTAPRHLGHNPAGGAMTVLLLLALAVTTVSGMMVYAIEENAGPLAGFVMSTDRPAPALALVPRAVADDDDEEHSRGGHDEQGEEFWEEIHEIAANLCLALIILHILGVIASSLAHHENLPRAMVTGRKRAE